MVRVIISIHAHTLKGQTVNQEEKADRDNVKATPIGTNNLPYLTLPFVKLTWGRSETRTLNRINGVLTIPIYNSNLNLNTDLKKELYKKTTSVHLKTIVDSRVGSERR